MALTLHADKKQQQLHPTRPKFIEISVVKAIRPSITL